MELTNIFHLLDQRGKLIILILKRLPKVVLVFFSLSSYSAASVMFFNSYLIFFYFSFFWGGAVALSTSNALLEHEYLYTTTHPQPVICTPSHGLIRRGVITPNPVIKGK